MKFSIHHHRRPDLPHVRQLIMMEKILTMPSIIARKIDAIASTIAMMTYPIVPKIDSIHDRTAPIFLK